MWKNLNDKRQVVSWERETETGFGFQDYSKWYFAHTLNVYIAVEAVIPVARAVSEDAFRVLMGHCTCNGSPVFHKLIAFCSENTSCFVDADHARYASRALEKSAAARKVFSDILVSYGIQSASGQSSLLELPKEISLSPTLNGTWMRLPIHLGMLYRLTPNSLLLLT